MPHLLDKLYWFEPDQTPGGRAPPPEQLVDVEDADVVLDFAYSFLEAHALPPSDNEVHNVTAAIARYKGPGVVGWATLESFLARFLTKELA
jgi:hypothetical protein